MSHSMHAMLCELTTAVDDPLPRGPHFTSSPTNEQAVIQQPAELSHRHAPLPRGHEVLPACAWGHT